MLKTLSYYADCLLLFVFLITYFWLASYFISELPDGWALSHIRWWSFPLTLTLAFGALVAAVVGGYVGKAIDEKYYGKR